MKILVADDEAADRLEELIELAACGDEILVCRNDRPIAALTYIATKEGSMEELLRLAAEGRSSVPGETTSNHDDLYDENGLPK